MDNAIPNIEPSYAVLVRHAHEYMGGRAGLDDVIAEVRRMHPDRWERQAISAMRNATRHALTEHDASGMPHASSIGDEYVQRSLFTVDNYETTITRYIGQSADLLATAERLSDECAGRFGIRYPVPGHDGNDPQVGAA